MKPRQFVFQSCLTAIVSVCAGACGSGQDRSTDASRPAAAQATIPARPEPNNPKGQATYVDRYPNGFSLIRYAGELARKFPGEPEAVVVLLDSASNPVYALGPEGQSIEFYKITKTQGLELIYAISLGPRETRIFEGPFRPEEGFQRRIDNVGGAPGIDPVYLNPSARQKAQWFEELPNLASLKIQRTNRR